MYLKLVGGGIPVVALGLFVAGFFEATGFAREVDQPPELVLEAISDMEIGTRDRPVQLRPEHDSNRISWTVNDNGRVAARMTATMEPLDGGRRTRIRAEIEGGPELQPAFRTLSGALEQFAAAMDKELTEVGPDGWGLICDAMIVRFLMENSDVRLSESDSNMETVFTAARVAGSAMQLQRQLTSAGCDINQPFRQLRGWDAGDRSRPRWSRQPGHSTVSFEPGRPMTAPRPMTTPQPMTSPRPMVDLR